MQVGESRSVYVSGAPTKFQSRLSEEGGAVQPWFPRFSVARELRGSVSCFKTPIFLMATAE